MNVRIVIRFVFFACWCASCTVNEPQMEQAWIYMEPSGEQHTKDIRRYGVNMEYGLNAANFLDLQPDGSFTSYLGTFEQGRWKRNDSMLLLTNAQNHTLKLYVLRLSNDELLLGSKVKRKLYYFTGMPNRFDDPAQNPFSAANNRWRIPPKQKETDAELYRRLGNHFAFWEKYFSWGEKHNIEVLPISETPSLLKVYSNGVKLEYFEYLLPEWQRVFYDTADSRRAYNDFYYTMHANDINWKETKNNFQRMSDAFHQMQQWMEKKQN